MHSVWCAVQRVIRGQGLIINAATWPYIQSTTTIQCQLTITMTRCTMMMTNNPPAPPLYCALFTQILVYTTHDSGYLVTFFNHFKNRNKNNNNK